MIIVLIITQPGLPAFLAVTWCQTLLLTAEASEELSFWLKHIEKFNGQNIWPKPSAVQVVYTDASSTDFGGYYVDHGDQVLMGQWSEVESRQSSTWKELRAIHLVLNSMYHKLQNHKVRWFTDNQNVIRIVARSRSYKRRHWQWECLFYGLEDDLWTG